MRKQKMFLSIKSLMFIGIIFVLLSCAHKQPQPFNNFEEAAKKLNTPTLIDEYQKKYFEWKSMREGGGCNEWNIGVNLEGCPPSFIFNNKGKGNCGAYTTFSVYCLRKAGYEAYPLYVYLKWRDDLAPDAKPRNYHIMVLYKENGKWYTIDDGIPWRGGGPQGIKGPFNTIEDLPYKVLRVDKEYK